MEICRTISKNKDLTTQETQALNPRKGSWLSEERTYNIYNSFFQKKTEKEHFKLRMFWKSNIPANGCSSTSAIHIFLEAVWPCPPRRFDLPERLHQLEWTNMKSPVWWIKSMGKEKEIPRLSTFYVASFPRKVPSFQFFQFQKCKAKQVTRSAPFV